MRTGRPDQGQAVLRLVRLCWGGAHQQAAGNHPTWQGAEEAAGLRVRVSLRCKAVQGALLLLLAAMGVLGCLVWRVRGLAGSGLMEQDGVADGVKHGAAAAAAAR